jgi:hypothetical protein
LLGLGDDMTLGDDDEPDVCDCDGDALMVVPELNELKKV